MNNTLSKKIGQCDTTFNFKEVNEVRNIMDNLKNKQGHDLYGLNIKIIKGIKNQLIIPLINLMNICFKQIFLEQS